MQSKEYFEFYGHPKIISGNRAMEHVPVELDAYDARRPLVISDKRTTGKGLHKKLIGALRDSNVTLGAVFDEVPDSAGIGLVRDMARLFKERGCDSIIALGSGAVMDAAKGVNMLAASGSADLLKFKGRDKVPGHLKPLAVIPAGPQKGYETSSTATIDRRAFVSDYLFPDLIVLDPRLTGAAGAGEVAGSALAALTHAVESSLPDVSSPINDTYAHAAIGFIFDNFVKALKSPRNRAAGLALANASAMAGIAWSNAPAGMAHLLGAAVSMETGLNPGICMGIILPHALEYGLRNNTGAVDGLLLAIAGFDEYSTVPEKERAIKVLSAVRGLLASSAAVMPSSFKELNVPAYRLESAARAVSGENKKYAFNDCIAVLKRSLEGASADEIKRQ